MFLRMLLWSLCLWALGAVAAELAPIPPANSLLVDQAGALSEEQRAGLEGRLKRIQEGGHAQVAVLISKGSPGEALAAYSLRVAEAWKIGRAGRDDGLLIVLLPASRALRLEVGYGLEGLIPDALASRWIGESLPLLNTGGAAEALEHILDQLEGVLPRPAPRSDDNYLFPDHPEWRLPFVLAVFSPFALFPMFPSRWGCLASAPLLAGMLGGAAWLLWGVTPKTWAAGAVAFLLPLMWSLHWQEEKRLPAWLRYAKLLGSLGAAAAMFAWIMLFVGTTLAAVSPEQLWAAYVFGGMFALGVAAMLLPGAVRHIVMLMLRSYVHFVFVLVLTYVALSGFVPRPEPLAFAVAAIFTALVALALYADSLKGPEAKRWSHVLIGLALLLVLPIGLSLLYLAVAGAGLAEGAAGGGSIAGVLWWAARSGFFAAVSVGLGGRFGGGGASGGE